MDWSRDVGHRYLVIGVDEKSGLDVASVYTAPSPEIALVLANCNGIRSATVRRVELEQWRQHPLRALLAWLSEFRPRKVATRQGQ
jgi:hypothetical protein